MKSFRSIVLEEDETMAADIPATAGDIEQTAGPIVSPDGNGDPTLAATDSGIKEEDIATAADTVAADIVDGEDIPEQDEQSVDAGADGAPVASVDATEGEPVASVDAPHEEPDGDEGPNPTAPSDNDGDEETDIIATAGEQAKESLVIVQCGLIATEAAMRLTNATSTEAFLVAKDNSAKKAVVEGFTSTIKGVWEKLKAFLIKIKNAIVTFAQKIIAYIKSLFARVYAKMVKSIYAKKAQANWGKAAAKVELKVPDVIAKDGVNTHKSQKDVIAANKEKLAKIAACKDVASVNVFYQSNKKSLAGSIKHYNSKSEKTVKVATLFASYAAANAFIKAGYENSVKNINELAKAVNDACDKEIKELNPKDNANLHSAKVKAINMLANASNTDIRLCSAVLVKCLRLAATSIKRVAGYKATKESYIDEDLMAFFNA